MATATNTLVQSNKQNVSFGSYAKSEKAQQGLMAYIPDQKERAMFTSAIVGAVASNPTIATCTNESIMSAGLKCMNYGFLPGGETGDVYLIPFGDRCTVMLGYKGLVRLAQRSGRVRTLNMDVVRKGQTVVKDFLTGDIAITGVPESPDAEAIGYFAFIRLSGSGFEKAEYMTKAEAIAHAKKYAKSKFDPAILERYEQYMQTGEGMTQKEAESLGVYYQHFDTMAQKNVMLRLLKRWAPLSVTEQRMLAEDENPGEAFDMPGFESQPEQPDSVAEPVTTGASANRVKRPKDVTPAGDAAGDDFFN